MRIRNIVVGLGLALTSTIALASHCPMDMKKIDTALTGKHNLTAAQMSEVKQLRADGQALHKAGKHKESEAALGKAMKMLNIQ